MTVDDENTLHDDAIADADLVLRTRSGDATAFGELWRRHYPSGMSVARSITSSIDPDDLVQESYTRIYQAIIKGGGPNGSFRAYLFTSIRNTAAAWGRSRRESAIDELDAVADPDSTEQAANEALDRGLTSQAFRSLPSRWQEVLWYTEIEQMKPNEVAPLLGMKAGAVSQLAFRAREGLREAWIQAHLRSAAPGSDCQWTIEHLGAYTRGNLSTRDHKRLEQHLDECARCMIVAAEAKDVSKRLALVLLPLVLGIAGSAGYLATLQGGGAPIVALAAMPSSVVQGGVVAGGAAGGAAGGSAGSGAGGSAGGGAAAAGGIFTGVGALVGAGSAALIVAGVVAAATILPGLSSADPSTSLSNAAASDSSSIAADIAPDDSMSSEETTVVEPPAPPAPPAPQPPVEEASAPESAPVVTPPAPPVTPEKPVDPVKPVDPEKPVDPIDPIDPEPPVLPEGAPTFVSADVTCTWDPTELIPVTHYRIQVSGAVGATAQVLLDGSTAGTTGAVLDSAGSGVVDVRPTLSQILDNVGVSFQYTLLLPDGTLKVGEPGETTALWDIGLPTECVRIGDAPSGTDPGDEGTAPAEDPLASDTPASIAPESPVSDPAPVESVAPVDPAASVEPAAPPAPVAPAPAPVEAPAAPAPEDSTAPAQASLLGAAVDTVADVAGTAPSPAE
ncbi:sigma-70 family RNA polymerase sigma factor [Microbacterium sp. LWH10-1.2]|uniref:sigma-70 family RNA polymerase sigma factor n=1 Tax=Microbacterium sp. LWH10-1.2 TaxID=3135255 RepID=UPI003138AF74